MSPVVRIGPAIFAILLISQVFGMSLTLGADVDFSTLRREHPRLFLPDLDLPRLKQAIADDPQLVDIHKRLTRDAEKILSEKPVERVLVGPRLLDQSRLALRRISLLAGLYRLDGDTRFADRVIAEMLAAAAFEDWNPSHFLDVAEMTNAMAIGYDWLFDRLTPEQRNTIRTAIIEKGLKPGLACYNGTGKGWRWDKSTNNWNQVCNGGLTVGALAIADEEPELALQILENAKRTIPLALASYAPDGGWEEGPGYWTYASRYTVYFLAALNSAIGTDWGLSDSPGLASAGDFRMHEIGPTGLVFNFADARPDSELAPAMLYFAHRFDRPDYTIHEMNFAGAKRRLEIFHLLWSASAWKGGPKLAIATSRPTGKMQERTWTPATNQASRPLDAIFRRIDVALFRSAWDDPNATFVGFKGGDNAAGHSHLDLGTFVLDSQGQRWAIDLGPDDYNLPGYFGKDRFTYYRLRTEGHNTITFGGKNQSLTAKAPIVAYSSKSDEAFAVADLSAAYPDELKRARRGIKLFDQRRSVLVQDDIEPRTPVDLVWTVHTTADVQMDANVARMKLGGREMVATIVSPARAKFEVEPVNPPAPQMQDPKIKKIVIKLERAGNPERVAVVFSPVEERGVGAPNLVSLDDWISAAPVPPVR